MAQDNDVTPFILADFEDLKKSQRKLADLVPLLDKAERCGTDCQVYRSIVGELGKRLESIEREFMNPIPPS